MVHKKGRINPFLLILAVLLSLGLSGCMGPTTRVLVREPEHHAPGYTDSAPSREDVNAFYLWETIDFLSGQTREPGSLGAAMASDYMKQLLADYGYQTEVSSGIVSAVRAADSQEADIVIIASNYGSSPVSPGASDNASGIAVFLETARLAAETTASDTELRFVAFPGDGSGWEAARIYVSGLTPEEKHRVIGEIQIGPLGYSDFQDVILGTEDGKETFLGDQINEAAAAVTGSTLPYVVREGGAHAVFLRGQIPAVCLTQKNEAYEQGTMLDRLELIDVDQLVPVVNILRRMLADLMREDTPSMIAKSRFYNDLRDEAYVQQLEAALPFGKDRNTLESRTGQSGIYVSQNTTNDGKPMEAYRYPMKWFGVDQILYSDYYFVDGKLAFVSVEGDAAGVDTEDMVGRISSVYGDPYMVSEGPGGTEYNWSDPLRRVHLAMIPESDGYELEIREYDTQPAEILPEDGRADRLKSLIMQIIPQEDAESVSVSIYTDGIGKTDHYIEMVENHSEEESSQEKEADGEDGTQELSWIIGMDLEDAVREDGSWRNYTATVRQIINLYGQILSQQEQKQYRAAFDERFVQAAEQELEQEVEQETGQSVSPSPDDMPDFAESFQWFVLTRNRKAVPGEWGERIRFFEAFEELVSYRSQVRENLKLPEAEEVIVGEAPAGS